MGKQAFRNLLCMFVCGVGVGVRIWVGCPCPPVRNNIVTPRHLFLLVTIAFLVTCYALYTSFFFVRPSVGQSPFYFFGDSSAFLGSLLLPECFTDLLHQCPCPRASDWGSRVTGHVKGPLSRLLHSFPHSLRSPLRFATLASLCSIHK